jgi:ACT domain
VLVRLRISLPDRPGSLGRVATALGAAGADIARVDVLGGESGQAVDDVFVELSGPEHLERVRFALDRIGGVRLVGAQHPVPPVTGHTDLELVDRVVSRPDRGLKTLVDGAPAALGADWCAVLEWGPSGVPDAVIAVSAGCPGKEAVSVNAPLRLQPVRLGRPDGGEPYGGAAVVPLAPTDTGLLLVRENGPEYHPAELWRLGQLGEVCGSVLARA